MKKIFNLKNLIKLGFLILFIHSLYDTYIWLMIDQSRDTAFGFVFGLFYLTLFSIAFKGIDFFYDEIKGWISKARG